VETTVENGITYTYNHKELNEKINNTIDIIKKIVKNRNYQVTGEIKNYNLDYKWLSKSQMKRLQKYCFWIENKPTLRRINTFFGLLGRYFDIERVHVKVSLKEEKIQKARKEWLKARDESDRLLAIYKKEKGNFYKNNLFIK
jgi:hypothetical protein